MVTDAFKAKIVSRGIDASKIDVHKNGVILDLFTPREKDSSLSLHPQLEGKQVFAYIGTHGMAHALAFILTAFPRPRHRCLKPISSS